jgi:hypothetical protein
MYSNALKEVKIMEPVVEEYLDSTCIASTGGNMDLDYF